MSSEQLPGNLQRLEVVPGDVYDTQTWKWTLSSNQFAFILGVKYVIHCIYEVSAGHGLVYSFGN